MKFFQRDRMAETSPELVITPQTNPKVARAMIEAWQASQELQLFDAITAHIRDAERKGLETRRMGKVLSQIGAALERVGGAPESNGSAK